MKVNELIKILEKHKGHNVNVQVGLTDNWIKDEIRIESNKITEELTLIVEFKDYDLIHLTDLDRLKNSERELDDYIYQSENCCCYCCN